MRRILGWGLLFLGAAACGGEPSDGDAGAGNGGNGASDGSGGNGGVSNGDGATGTPTVCTSRTFWMGGDKGSELMHPGRACQTCHSSNREAPKLTIAGTVYPTSHEPDECNGRDGSSGITIVVTDATGKQLPPIPVNSVGNFRYERAVAAPFHVKVVFNGKENAMSASPESGECNSCHTETGANGAPGRILAP